MTAAMYRSLAKAHERIATLYNKEADSLETTKKPRTKKAVKKKAVKKRVRR